MAIGEHNNNKHTAVINKEHISACHASELRLLVTSAWYSHQSSVDMFGSNTTECFRVRDICLVTSYFMDVA